MSYVGMTQYREWTRGRTHKTSCCGQMPITFRISDISEPMSRPNTRARPDVGGISPDEGETENMERNTDDDDEEEGIFEDLELGGGRTGGNKTKDDLEIGGRRTGGNKTKDDLEMGGRRTGGNKTKDDLEMGGRRTGVNKRKDEKCRVWCH
jgi:hypothetical protein